MSHANVPIFIPHLGCPHTCSFCNQQVISGELQAPTAKQVKATIIAAKESLGERMHSAQLAFFGGSFTAIDKKYRISLLEAAQDFIGDSGFEGIRISTRPDCISEDIIDELKRYKVVAIELGVQSMRENVLQANNRGHSSADVIKASSLIKNSGIELGHQMMTGLFEDDDSGALETARKIIELRPATVRIYPTIVLEGTTLASYWREGIYSPPTLENTITLGAKLLDMFSAANIPVIRFGLQSEQNLEKNILAGAHHPALRELCESQLMQDKISKILPINKREITIAVNSSCVSKTVGHSRSNINYFEKLGYKIKVIPDNSVAIMDFKLL